MRSAYYLTIKVNAYIYLMYATEERAFGYAYDEGGYGEQGSGGQIYFAGILSIPDIPLVEQGSAQITLSIFDHDDLITLIMRRVGAFALSHKEATLRRLDYDDFSRPVFRTVFDGHTDEGIEFKSSSIIDIPMIDKKFTDSIKVPNKVLTTSLFPNLANSEGLPYTVIYGSDKEVPLRYINTANYKYMLAGHATKAAPATVYKSDTIPILTPFAVDLVMEEGIVVVDSGDWTTAHELDPDQRSYRSVTFVENIGDNANLFADVEGRYDDVAGTFTGTGSALIELPHHIVTSIYVNEEQLTTSHIDRTKTSALDTAFSGWKFTKSMVELNDSDVWIDEISANTYGLLKVVTLSDGLKYPYKAGEDTDSISFLFEEHINILDIEQDIVVGLTSLDNVASEIIIRYDYNYRQGKYNKTLRKQGKLIGDTDYDTTLAATYANYNNYDNTIELECSWIRDATTVNNLMTWMVRCAQLQRWTCMLSAAYTEDSTGRRINDLKIGDIAGITYKKYGWTQKKFQINRMSITEGGLSVHVELEETVG